MARKPNPLQLLALWAAAHPADFRGPRPSFQPRFEHPPPANPWVDPQTSRRGAPSIWDMYPPLNPLVQGPWEQGNPEPDTAGPLKQIVPNYPMGGPMAGAPIPYPNAALASALRRATLGQIKRIQPLVQPLGGPLAGAPTRYQPYHGFAARPIRLGE